MVASLNLFCVDKKDKKNARRSGHDCCITLDYFDAGATVFSSLAGVLFAGFASFLTSALAAGALAAGAGAATAGLASSFLAAGA
jgi:hypothetical protein